MGLQWGPVGTTACTIFTTFPYQLLKLTINQPWKLTPLNLLCHLSYLLSSLVFNVHFAASWYTYVTWPHTCPNSRSLLQASFLHLWIRFGVDIWGVWRVQRGTTRAMYVKFTCFQRRSESKEHFLSRSRQSNVQMSRLWTRDMAWTTNNDETYVLGSSRNCPPFRATVVASAHPSYFLPTHTRKVHSTCWFPTNMAILPTTELDTKLITETGKSLWRYLPDGYVKNYGHRATSCNCILNKINSISTMINSSSTNHTPSSFPVVHVVFSWATSGWWS